MFLKGKKEEEKNNKLIEWGYTKLTNKTFCVYIINYCNMDTLKKKVEEINNAKVIPKISLDINYYMEFYISNRDFKRDFKDGIDVHTATASRILGKRAEDITKEERSLGKTVNFGVLFGQTGYGLASMLGIDTDAASKYIQSYFAHYVGVENYIRNLEKEAY